MTTVSYALGVPRPPGLRGGDCRAYDLAQVRHVRGPHRFATADDCQLRNGFLRVTVGSTGEVPTLAVDAWRPEVTINDTYSDTYSDTYGGDLSTPAWLTVGSLVIDSPDVDAVLTGVRLVRITAESVTIRLVSPLISDAFVTLRRGERMLRIQHGSSRAPVTRTRRVGWDLVPEETMLLTTEDGRVLTTEAGVPLVAEVAVQITSSPTGRSEEVVPHTQGFPRFVASLDPTGTTAGTLGLTSGSVDYARFGAGVATYSPEEQPRDMHRQLRDSSRPRLVVA